MKKMAKVLVTIVALFGLFGILVYLTMSPNEVTCEVCMEFRGKTECRKATGKDRVEAEGAAISTACGLISGGVTDGIACRNSAPQRVSCTAP
jgi:hypothetical protein